ncbi:MAG TPA: leucyl/phenylalanyl-tRNA--protein transferase [Candidatus Acidoferrum sp.]|nr:leucyl/phenylalanyl-tRNA--protein transferase [Candidatus Acidoferrum sp.]
MSLVLPWLEPDTLEFPDTATALTTPNGLLAAGGDLHPQRLLAAYRHGIFPWFSDNQPILWWSPDPRMVLFPDELHISRSLAKVLKHATFTVTTDQAYAQVLTGCAGPRPGSDGTWLDSSMQQAYQTLQTLGHAHSIEVWSDGQLVGGLYGVALDGIFFGESMFSRAANASKIALVWLTSRLAALDYRIIDCQVPTPHLASMGARLIPRCEFNHYLPATADISRPARWPIQ